MILRDLNDRGIVLLVVFGVFGVDSLMRRNGFARFDAVVGWFSKNAMMEKSFCFLV